MDFQLKGEFIELDNLLKATGLVASGAVAKQAVQSGAVKVNGEVESRVRRKLRTGDVVELGEQKVTIAAGEEPKAGGEGPAISGAAV